ncbi:MAG: hypothetical protein U0230_19520 [Polyangiales bacterium]
MNRHYVFLGLLATALAGCPPTGPYVPTGGSPGQGTAQLSSQCANPNYGVSAGARKISSFLVATNAYARSAGELDAQLLRTCQTMARELGIPASELGSGTQGVCEAVATRISSEMRSLRAEANVRIGVIAVPPQCELDIDAYARCAAECDVQVDPGHVQIQCEGGQIVGQCSAQCTGECDVGAQAQCAGSCEGICQGGCSGRCDGQCDGQCSATGADGQCHGTCSGTCHGSCSAGCQGSCQGQCWVQAHAQCTGDCRGGCSVEYTRPRCTTDIERPQIQADCHASCDARFHAEAHCTPGHVEVTVVGEVGVNQERVQRIRAALLAGYGDIEAIRMRLKWLQQSGNDLRGAIRNLRGVGGDLGAGALACMTEAFSVIPQVVGSVAVSVQVSVDVSASVSGSVN